MLYDFFFFSIKQLYVVKGYKLIFIFCATSHQICTQMKMHVVKSLNGVSICGMIHLR